MADEDKKVAEGENKEGENKEPPKEEPKKEEGMSAAERDRVEKALKVYENINDRYKKDPAFRAQFDKAWEGSEAKGDDEADEGDDDDLTPIEQMRKEMKTLREELGKSKDEIDNLRNVYGYDKLTEKRQRVNLQYENDFRKMAEGVGYDPGSDAYESLYADVLREGKRLAKEYGLVNDGGDIDPLKEYNKEFLKKSFDNAYDRHKRAGFSEAWNRKKHADSMKRNEVKDELSQYFDPKKLKTAEDRAKALELSFKHKFGNMKMV